MGAQGSILNDLKGVLASAGRRSHRQLVVLSGTQAWCQAQMDGFSYPPLQQTESDDQAPGWLWVGEPEGLKPPAMLQLVSAKQAHQLLGRECQGIVFDSWSGFNPNGFGQVVGTLVAGGVFILITPPTDQWLRFDDPEYRHIAVPPFTAADVGRRFILHLQNTIAADSELLHFEQGKPDPRRLLPGDSHRLLPVPAIALEAELAPFKTLDQQAAVEHGEDILNQSRAVTVITADRGRGKSAALGLLAARLMQQRYRQAVTDTGSVLDILLTAPSRSAIQAVVLQLQRSFTEGSLQCERDCWRVGQSRLRFFLPDQLLQCRPEADLLLVDEAAAIPAPVLLSLLAYPRVVFASTLHGYEGTGQGFAVRFMPYLDRQVPQRQLLCLRQPVRWAEGDPLERFSYQALMLDAEPADMTAAKHLALCFRKLDRDVLVADTRQLKQLFGLLILAHYRTTPGDLRILLDSPNIEIWAGFIEQAGEEQLVAAVLLAYEGPIETELANAIINGTRRPKGQLIPQTLLAHCQIPAAADCRGLRVMRIAVHPQLQRRGIGSQLLHVVEQGVVDIDWLGASFGATPALCCFWQRFGLQLQRLGHHRDKVSGTYAAVMLRGVSDAGMALQQQGAEKAAQQLQQLALTGTMIDADLLAALDGQSFNGSLG